MPHDIPYPGFTHIDLNRAILAQGRGRIARSYMEAARAGVADPVVLVVDASRPRSRAVAEALSGPGPVRDVVAASRLAGGEAMLTLAVARTAAVRALAAAFPEASLALAERRGPGGVVVTEIATPFTLAIAPSSARGRPGARPRSGKRRRRPRG